MLKASTQNVDGTEDPSNKVLKTSNMWRFLHLATLFAEEYKDKSVEKQFPCFGENHEICETYSLLE